jgi:hypothetical protein
LSAKWHIGTCHWVLIRSLRNSLLAALIVWFDICIALLGIDVYTQKLVSYILMFVLCIVRRSRNNQHYALICTTPLFYILAPTCFGSSLPSSGSFLDPSELLEIQIVWVVCHIMCGYVACVPECRGSVCCASQLRTYALSWEAQLTDVHLVLLKEHGVCPLSRSVGKCCCRAVVAVDRKHRTKNYICIHCAAEST